MKTTDGRTPQTKLQIVLFDPEQYLSIMGSAIRQLAPRWEVKRVEDKDMLLSFLGSHSPDVVVLTGGMGVAQHLSLLTQLQERHPEIIRVTVCAKLWTAQQQAQASDLSHRVFSFDPQPSRLVSAIEQAAKVRISLSRAELRRGVMAMDRIPSPPTSYYELSRLLRREDTNSAMLAAVIEKDPAMAARLLMLVNSAQLGVGRSISRLDQAISLLGLRTLRGLLLASHLSSVYEGRSRGVDLQRLNHRSFAVARLAQTIAKEAGLEVSQVEQAFIGGLLHRLGIPMLMSLDEDKYRLVISLAKDKNRPLHIVEKALTGVFHGELAAALLRLWALPPQAVEAVGYFSVPHVIKETSVMPVTAVHIADALIDGSGCIEGINLQGKLNLEYLKELKLDQKLGRWRIIAKGMEQRVAI